eukprot:SAG22_NODE_19392_length_275_cov_0.875000_1_plen_67_part_10
MLGSGHALTPESLLVRVAYPCPGADAVHPYSVRRHHLGLQVSVAAVGRIHTIETPRGYLQPLNGSLV